MSSVDGGIDAPATTTRSASFPTSVSTRVCFNLCGVVLGIRFFLVNMFSSLRLWSSNPAQWTAAWECTAVRLLSLYCRSPEPHGVWSRPCAKPRSASTSRSSHSFARFLKDNDDDKRKLAREIA
jgi:hypothetical protein